MDTMVWTTGITELVAPLDHNDDFVTVSSAKSRKSSGMGFGIIPPDRKTGLALSFSAYTPATLASPLKIPATLLPLLGALIGNDFIPPAKSHPVLFDRHTTPMERIEAVSSAIQRLLSDSLKDIRKGQSNVQRQPQDLTMRGARLQMSLLRLMHCQPQHAIEYTHLIPPKILGRLSKPDQQ